MSNPIETVERWRKVSFAPTYSVSDHGRVTGKGGKLLSLTPNRFGYVRVCMVMGQQRKSVSVHALVLHAFLSPRPEGMVIDHINGDKADNRLANLRYLTSAENTKAAKRLGLNAFGVRHGSSKLTPDAVLEIRALRAAGVVQRKIAKRFGISQTHVRDVISGRNWSHV